MWEKIKKSTAVIFIRTVCSPFTYCSLTIHSTFTHRSITDHSPFTKHSLTFSTICSSFATICSPFTHRSLNLYSTFAQHSLIFPYHSLTVRTSFMWESGMFQGFYIYDYPICRNTKYLGNNLSLIFCISKD